MVRHRFWPSFLARATLPLIPLSKLSGMTPASRQSIDTCLSSLEGRIFLLDGGTGEELFARGVPDDRKIWSATAVVNEEYHDILQSVHRSFLEAGSNAITTNTYGIVPGVGFSSEEIETYCKIASSLARQVVDEYADNRYVLGSLGPLVESYRPDMIMEHKKGVPYYETMIKAMASDVDAFVAETSSSVEESMQPIRALANCNVSKPIFISFTLNSDGSLRSKEVAEEAVPRILDYAKHLNIRVLAILFNCCEPEAISIAFKRMNANRKVAEAFEEQSCLRGAYANRLTPIAPDWTLEGSDEPQPFRTDMQPNEYGERFVKPWHKVDEVCIVGGCCGITPEHISYLKQTMKTK